MHQKQPPAKMAVLVLVDVALVGVGLGSVRPWALLQPNRRILQARARKSCLKRGTGGSWEDWIYSIINQCKKLGWGLSLLDSRIAKLDKR
jgi:hypothetical protein